MTMKHSHLNDMEILGTKCFIPRGFELGTTLKFAELIYLFVDAVVLSQREVKCIAQRGVAHCFLTNEITAS